jgi:hypothetical protein
MFDDFRSIFARLPCRMETPMLMLLGFADGLLK